ncbi:MAG: dihydrolipoyl dehydrogenase [Zhongshania sp.]|uniref:dihydrolipoyl dehydrogenase n=1 Tax=Zhongshania sp. TaxID=1971902 RepID=UPI002624A597|nr:dihydrolipoyl dehydrogenase [Zhongshania sp.]MDF1691474.1 dihydrolipoyl dehydrogenase [Zhongshania sp.]
MIEIRVPDIGGANGVEVIEILVSMGDHVEAEQGLITLETDKATMEIPSPRAGVVGELTVKIGDKVSAGALIAVLKNSVQAEAAQTIATKTSAPDLVPQTGSGASIRSSQADEIWCDVLVLGAGPGGYSAAFRAADLGAKVVMVERYASLGGVCLNVGCIPSKALLHVAAVMDETKHFAGVGVNFAAPAVDLTKLRSHKEAVVGKLTGGLAAMANMRGVSVLNGNAYFIDSQRLQVNDGEKGRVVHFKRAIIAAGSQAQRLPFLPDDPRIIDSTGALELPLVPKRMLIIGGGIIGLEMATVYAALGARIDVVEMIDSLIPSADRDLVNVWQKYNSARFDKLMLGTRTVSAEATSQGIRVAFAGANAPSEPQMYDLVLEAVGREPNGKRIGAEHAGVAVDERGFISVDRQMRTNVPHIFAVGDIVGQPMLAHKAVHEAHVAAEVAVGELIADARLTRAAFEPRVIPSVAYTNPEIAWVGLSEAQAKAENRQYKKGLFPWRASGRAIANGRDEGFTKLLFDAETGQIVGGGIVGTGAGDLISEVALAIEMGADQVDIAKTIHPHPTLGESVGLAAEAAHGICTDLPPVRH